MIKIRVDAYCNFCGRDDLPMLKTHDEKDICTKCAEDPRLHFCEICGSTTEYYGQHPDHQKHYNELCFK
jgi:hypothetical protein